MILSTNKDGRSYLYTICVCTDASHTMRFVLFHSDSLDPYPELYVDVQLNQWRPWWSRAWYALLYVLGKRSRFGNGQWEEGSLTRKDALELRRLLDAFIDETGRIDGIGLLEKQEGAP